MNSDEKQQFVYAGFWKRAAAYIIDMILITFISPLWLLPILFYFGGSIIETYSQDDSLEFTAQIYSSPGQLSHEDVYSIIAAFIFAGLVSLLIRWLYFSIMESSVKQGTVGKMILGIKVTTINGGRISFARATGRFFAKILSSLFLFIGYIMAAFTQRKQALHDIIAETLVIDRIFVPYSNTREKL